MFKEEMVAPCGINCALCVLAHDAENPCGGCLGPDAQKPGHCANACMIPKCEMREKLDDKRFCDLCEKYPCPTILSMEVRYANEYPMVQSLIGNLACIRKQGMEYFLNMETMRWTCPVCGGVICVHTGLCSDCGRAYTIRTMKRPDE